MKENLRELTIYTQNTNITKKSVKDLKNAIENFTSLEDFYFPHDLKFGNEIS